MLCGGIKKRDRYLVDEFPCMESSQIREGFHVNEWEAERIKVVGGRVLVQSRGSLLKERHGDPYRSSTPACDRHEVDQDAEEL